MTRRLSYIVVVSVPGQEWAGRRLIIDNVRTKAEAWCAAECRLRTGEVVRSVSPIEWIPAHSDRE